MLTLTLEAADAKELQDTINGLATARALTGEMGPPTPEPVEPVEPVEPIEAAPKAKRKPRKKAAPKEQAVVIEIGEPVATNGAAEPAITWDQMVDAGGAYQEAHGVTSLRDFLSDNAQVRRLSDVPAERRREVYTALVEQAAATA